MTLALFAVVVLLIALAIVALRARKARSSDSGGKRSDGKATCGHCRAQFDYFLVHNGFNDSAYAYCDTCGMTALLSGWATNIPAQVELHVHQPVTAEVEPWLRPCSCGGRFRGHASPRCPECHEPFPAAGLTSDIERNAPGTKVGWRWQQNWSGLYAIVIENRMIADNWLSREQ